MNSNDKNKDKLNKENTDKTINEGNSVPNIRPVEQEDVTNAKAEAGEIGGVNPRKSGSRGGTSVEDGGQDVGSSAGSR